ncbi:MAG: spondin domain-containing protein [Cytophagales bacterium]|nr:spondin domain-containing protein [Cytophagales bacterium]
MHKTYIWIIVLLCFAGCEGIPDTRAEFTVTIENLSGTEAAPEVILSRGVFMTHRGGHPLFFNFSFEYGQGLEELAEDGINDTLFNNLSVRRDVIETGVFPDILPGESVSFSFSASYGDSFNLASMFTESNDAFYAYNDDGISLFHPDGEPISGDFTRKVFLWDAGTELNEEPYEGPNQPARQMNLNQGEFTAFERVRLIDDGFSYPAKTSVLRITFSPTTR